jgi:hypothetical protein
MLVALLPSKRSANRDTETRHAIPRREALAEVVEEELPVWRERAGQGWVRVGWAVQGEAVGRDVVVLAAEEVPGVWEVLAVPVAWAEWRGDGSGVRGR